MASATGAAYVFIASALADFISSKESNGVKTGPLPSLKARSLPRADKTKRMSEKIIDASKPNFLIGCNVTSQALSGVRQKLTKSGVVFRTALYSGK